MKGLDSFTRRRKRDVRFRLLNPGRYAVDIATSSVTGMFRGTGAARPIRILLVSDAREPTSEEQYNPFDAFRAMLKADARILSAHLLVHDALVIPVRLLSSFDAIGLKLSFRITAAETLRIVRRMRVIAGTRPIIFFDGDDDVCIKQPRMLPDVNLYVKKHVFADRRDYLKSYVGKSNLTDYVHRRFGFSFADDAYASEPEPVAEDQLEKIVTGWNLALDSNILALYARVCAAPPPIERTVDVMFRGAIPNNWLRFLRQDVEPSLLSLRSTFKVIVPTERVDKEGYYREMMRSRICLSPFGYGEICWRDFEAILCGCLLIKPDMGHLQTAPNVFQPNVTYIPIRWDFSDLAEKCAYYLARPDECRRVTAAALDVLAGYYVNRGFLESVAEILRRIGLR